jgi:hypothetical protein
MSLVFGKQNESTVKSLLDEVLRSATVSFRQFVDIEAASVKRLVDRLRDIGSKQKLPLPWLTERTVTKFLGDRLSAKVAEAKAHEGTWTSLIAAPGFDDNASLVASLFDELATLPWQYRIMLPLSFGCTGEATRKFTLDDSFRVETFDAADAACITLHPVKDREAKYYYRMFPGVIDTDTAYFVGETIGYLPETQPSSAVEEYVHVWKGFMGLLLVDGSLFLGERPPGPPEPALPIVIHRIREHADSVLLPYKWLTLQDSALLGRLASTDKLRDDPETAIASTRRSFQHLQTRSAARWYVDSLAGEGGVLEIVAATMALEILLGDEAESDSVGVTSLLANRLAFMIGGSPRERHRVLTAFKRLYKVRSEIVHAGKASLSDSERTVLLELQELARRAIQTQIGAIRLEYMYEDRPRSG